MNSDRMQQQSNTGTYKNINSHYYGNEQQNPTSPRKHLAASTLDDINHGSPAASHRHHELS